MIVGTSGYGLEFQLLNDLMEEHAVEVASLWLQRDYYIRAPNCNLIDISEIDERLSIHIDALHLGENVGWDKSLEALEQEEPGEVFTAAVLAFRQNEGEAIEKVVDVACKKSETTRAIVSALAWSGGDLVGNLVEQLISANSKTFNYLGLSASAIYRQDLGTFLVSAASHSEPFVCARALRAVGELKRYDLLTVLEYQFNSENVSCRFWAVWSAMLLGNQNAIENLKQFFDIKSPYFDRAINMGLRFMEITRSQRWIKTLAKSPEARRQVIQGIGIMGDPKNIPWLIQQMQEPDIARVAGASLSMITGVDLAYEDLDGERPEGFEAGPTEDPEDPEVEMDPDEDLPWPNQELVKKWWQKNKNNYQTGIRYLCGEAITVEHCQVILRNGYQPQRRAAAIELALLQPENPLFNTSSPGFLQIALLSSSV